MQLGKNVPKKKINEISCFEWDIRLKRKDVSHRAGSSS
jgi:hypothetical protein